MWGSPALESPEDGGCLRLSKNALRWEGALSPFRVHRVKYCVWLPVAWVLGQGRGQAKMRAHRAPGWEGALQVGLDLSPSQPAEV